MSDSEEETFCFYGKPLDPYDEDAFPKKRPISIEDQIATDAQGRRRFHGAFTGGFSAGFFNTVGSLEGWAPSEFRSSRQEKAQSSLQKPEDYMDEEDRGQFGIAPETVRTTNDYAKNQKRKRQAFPDGPIPGEPVLQTLIESGNETIGYLLLKNIGLKHSQDDSEGRVYGCEMPAKYEIRSLPTCEIPQLYVEYLKQPKVNTFGMGYSGLDRSHINLFQSSGVVVREKNKKKFSIKGQAFGVGAFEEEDDDIYAREDMSNYDFELTSEKFKKKSAPMRQSDSILESFVHSKTPLITKINVPLPAIPRNFSGKHNITLPRASRWDRKAKTDHTEQKPLDRRDVNASVRSKYLGEASEGAATPSQRNPYAPTRNNLATAQNTTATPSLIQANNSIDNPPSSSDVNEDASPEQPNTNSNILYDRFVSAQQPDDATNLLASVERSETLHGTKEMRDAAKMKMFGPLTRTYLTWKPSALLCKRFNVPEPKYDDGAKKERKRTTHLIFEYQKQAEDDSPLKPGLTIKKEPEAEIELESNSMSVESNDLSATPSTSTASHEDTTANAASTEAKVAEDNSKPLDITEKLDVAKNIDLFKAVFLSSSESEGESDKEEDRSEKSEEIAQRSIEETARNELIKSNVLGETLIPKMRPVKDGILSNIDFSRFSKRKKANTSEEAEPKPEDEKPASSKALDERTKEIAPELNLYGPKLPERIVSNNTLSFSLKDSSSEDEWVEHKREKKAHKHKKKHKKVKHKKHKKEKR